MSNKILLCTDLDRTLIPNGAAIESLHARDHFRRLCQRPEVTLVYVSGRDQGLLQEAINDYHLPLPDYAIGDVGTSLFHITQQNWHLDQTWSEHIAKDWHGYDRQAIAQRLQHIPALRQQEVSKQNTYKLSYYLSLEQKHEAIIATMERVLEANKIHSNIIWSIDEPRQLGLIDVLPRAANKLEAIYFLQQQLDIPIEHIVFSGDSGNDISVLSSEIPATLVANADDDVRDEALRLAKQAGVEDRLYLAKGDFIGLNGNYSGGIIEGVCHYFPQAKAWL